MIKGLLLITIFVVMIFLVVVKSGFRFFNYFSFAAFLVVLILNFSCELQAEKEERLAKTYCGSCHLFPEPALLDRRTWDDSVLPEMAFRMGFPDTEIMQKIPYEDLAVVLRSVPERPIVSQQQWDAIRNYYLRSAPDSLSMNTLPIVDTLFQFNPLRIETIKQPFITLLHMDTMGQRLYAGTRQSALYKLDDQFLAVDSFLLDSTPSHILIDDDILYVLSMGIMDPNDQSKGQLIRIDEDKSKSVIIDSLQRPVHVEKADLNGNGQDDFIISSFGNYTGDLSIYEKSGAKFIKHVLNPSPGARKVIVKDINNDGLADILALLAQGDERVMMYTNKGDFKFEEATLLRFPPVYGSSYFEIADFNGDGYFDILLTNGDNADYSMILKPYHAVRVFENDGKNNFTESWSFPMPGASMAMARDFDGDGDLDIAAISFFPDFNNTPERSFIYFENIGNYEFRPRTAKFSIAARWLVMTVADYDNDGDDDILLGATNFRGLGASRELHNTWMSDVTPFLLLDNVASQKVR